LESVAELDLVPFWPPGSGRGKNQDPDPGWTSRIRSTDWINWIRLEGPLKGAGHYFTSQGHYFPSRGIISHPGGIISHPGALFPNPGALFPIPELYSLLLADSPHLLNVHALQYKRFSPSLPKVGKNFNVPALKDRVNFEYWYCQLSRELFILFYTMRVKLLQLNNMSALFPQRIPVHQCCGSGSGAFLTPGSGIRNRFIPDPGSQTHIFESLVTTF
jgi:hypothetical protein